MSRTEVDHVTCRELVERLTDYLDGVLAAEACAEIERHIVVCHGCSNYVEQFRTTIGLLGRIAADEPGDAQASAALAIFRHWQAGRPA
jgi:anti-sigma factor RsiW